jgi:hypothetical protein
LVVGGGGGGPKEKFECNTQENALWLVFTRTVSSENMKKSIFIQGIGNKNSEVLQANVSGLDFDV